MSPSYEDKRLENIRKNKALLAELQLGQLAAIASVHPSSTVQKKKHPSASSTTSTNPPFKRKKTLPVRSSLRLKGLQPDATASTLKSTTNPLSPTPALIPPKLKPDHFVANDAYLGGNLHILTTWESSSNGSLETTKENSLEENKKGEEEKEKEKQTKEVISWFSSFHAPSKPFPVTPTRVYSTIFAPLATKSIACVGDKVGSLSIWDITDYLSDPFSDQTPSVCTFQPHTGALSQLHFLEPHALSTLSFDGTLRVFDLNQQTFSTLFSTHGQETLHAFDPSEQTLWIGTGTGHVLQLDPRSKSLVHRLTHVHEKKCGCLMVHPQHSYWVLSSSNDRFIKLLDTRTL
ncbi:WD repeat-containing protein 76, partial [Coelomomyces lativittatus]